MTPGDLAIALVLLAVVAWWGWQTRSGLSTIGGMRWFRASLVVPALLLGVAGCASYDPPVQGDHSSQAYQADLEKCRSTSTEAARRRNADTPLTWIKSAFTGPKEVRAAIQTCMAGKGYVLEKAGG